jgi:hypothetical protein
MNKFDQMRFERDNIYRNIIYEKKNQHKVYGKDVEEFLELYKIEEEKKKGKKK